MSLFDRKPKVKAVVIDGDTYHVRAGSLSEFFAYQNAANSYPEDQRGVAGVVLAVVYFVCDADGKPLYTLDDFDRLNEVGLALVPLSNAALDHNSIDVMAAKKN